MLKVIFLSFNQKSALLPPRNSRAQKAGLVASFFIPPDVVKGPFSDLLLLGITSEEAG